MSSVLPLRTEAQKVSICRKHQKVNWIIYTFSGDNDALDVSTVSPLL